MAETQRFAGIELVVEFKHFGNAFLHDQCIAGLAAGHQHDELIAPDAAGAGRGIDGLASTSPARRSVASPPA